MSRMMVNFGYGQISPDSSVVIIFVIVYILYVYGTWELINRKVLSRKQSDPKNTISLCSNTSVYSKKISTIDNRIASAKTPNII